MKNDCNNLNSVSKNKIKQLIHAKSKLIVKSDLKKKKSDAMNLL